MMHQPISTKEKSALQEKNAAPLKLRTGVRAGMMLGAPPAERNGITSASAEAGCSPWDPRCRTASAAE